MKIAILSTISNYEWAGTEEVWAQFAVEALKQKHEVMLAADTKIAGSRRVAALKKLGLRVVDRKPFKPVRLYLLKEKFMSEMEGLIKFQPDVLLINSGSLYDVTNLPYLYELCMKIQTKKVFFCHFAADILRDTNINFVNTLYEEMDSVVFVSEHNMHLAERQLAMKLKNAKVVMNGPRLELSEPLPWPEGDEINFAIVARIETAMKGHDVLLNVLGTEKWKARKWHLNIYGKGPDEEYVSMLTKMYGISDRVNFCGYLDSMEELWSKNHVMVLPSRGEGTPLAVLEAMMCGRPTITTDAGGNKEILRDGQTGWIADTATDFSFGKIMELAWSEKERWQHMGAEAHNDAVVLAGDNPPQKLLSHLSSVVAN